MAPWMALSLAQKTLMHLDASGQQAPFRLVWGGSNTPPRPHGTERNTAGQNLIPPPPISYPRCSLFPVSGFRVFRAPPPPPYALPPRRSANCCGVCLSGAHGGQGLISYKREGNTCHETRGQTIFITIDTHTRHVPQSCCSSQVCRAGYDKITPTPLISRNATRCPQGLICLHTYI